MSSNTGITPGWRYPLPNSQALYGWRTCPTCSGSGINPKVPTYVCPKCHGEKRVPA